MENDSTPIEKMLSLRESYIEILAQAKASSNRHLPELEQGLREEWETRAADYIRLTSQKNWTAANRRTLLAGLRERLEDCITFLNRETERGDIPQHFALLLQTELTNLIWKYSRQIDREQATEEALF